jgi:hypothetical protein
MSKGPTGMRDNPYAVGLESRVRDGNCPKRPHEVGDPAPQPEEKASPSIASDFDPARHLGWTLIPMPDGSAIAKEYPAGKVYLAATPDGLGEKADRFFRGSWQYTVGDGFPIAFAPMSLDDAILYLDIVFSKISKDDPTIGPDVARIMGIDKRWRNALHSRAEAAAKSARGNKT